MSAPTTLLDSPSAISSPALASGPTPCDSPAGLMINLPGPGPAPASLSAWLAWVLGWTTSGTFGRTGSTSSSSDALRSSLVSRLKQRFATDGSILFRLTWKESATPSRRPVSLLRASVPRTSARAYSSWPTAAARDWKGATRERWGSNARPLNEVAALASWPTPCGQDGPNGGPSQGSDRLPGAAAIAGWPTCTAMDANRGAKDARPWDTGRPLNQIAALAGWGTPTANQPGGNGDQYVARSQAKTGNLAPTMLTHQVLLADGPARYTASGEMLTGSCAGMESGGQLNPAHSRWLMGLPPEWDDCAPTAMPSARRSRRNS